jgi:maltose alpha-D-glucosyltransferase/alpha-amylase
MGSGYNRAGARTPMQWGSGPTAGFSAAPAARLYLPVDPDPRRPTVAGQRASQDSLLHTVKDLIALRRAHPELGSGGSLEVLHDEYPLAYLRGGRFLVIINPSGRAHVLPHDRPGLAGATAVKHAGVNVDQATITAGPFSFGIFRL